MSEMFGPTGLTGDAGCMPKDEWHRFGVFGSGELRVAALSTDGPILKWISENHQSLPQVFGNSNSPNSGKMGEPTTKLSGPVQFTKKLIDCWQLKNLDASRLLGFGTGELDEFQSLLMGNCELRGRDIRDRILHLFHIRRNLWSLFRNLKVENDWLREDHELLDGTSPMSLMLEGSMENLLLVRDYIESAVGIR